MGKRRPIPETPALWLNTYSDMVTLLLCFFVAMFDPSAMESTAFEQVAASLSGAQAGTTLSTGRLSDLGNTIMSLPSTEKGTSLGTSKKKAIALFTPEIKSNKVRVTMDERGLVITLASDSFFDAASARVNIEQTRDTLSRLSQLLSSPELAKRKFRIEGHTDNSSTDPRGPWKSNWELSSQRAINVLHYLTDFGVNENHFQVAGFAGTVPLASNDTEEGRAYNRRVDIIILDEGHL